MVTVNTFTCAFCNPGKITSDVGLDIIEQIIVTMPGHENDIRRMAFRTDSHRFRMGTSKTRLKKLQGCGDENLVTFEMRAFPEDSTSLISDWLRCFCFKQNSYAFASLCDMAGNTRQVIERVSALMLNYLNPDYGIQYWRERRLGPDWYVTGITQGLSFVIPEQDEEAHVISHWGGLGMQERLYNQGIMRDVYPANYLNSSQLGMPLRGKNRWKSVTLEEWITLESGRGVIKPVNEKLKLWQLSNAEIAAVRPVLWDAGIIFNWRNFINT